jgi:hypothetical protein
MTSTTAATGAVPPGRVDAAIRQAAARSGVDFSYLYNQARVESGLNPNARAGNSTATGLFQFLDQTWLATVDKHGAANGLGWAADTIQRGRDGRYFVADPAARRQILDLRRNPEAASAMAAAFARDNHAYLETRLNRPLQSVDLYMAHFLGAGGASRFLRAHDSQPHASAAAAFPDAARANRNIFFKRDGTARTFAEVRNLMASKLGEGAAGGTVTRSAPQTAMAAAPTPATDAPTADVAFQLAALKEGTGFSPTMAVQPQYARLAYLMLAELGA